MRMYLMSDALFSMVAVGSWTNIFIQLTHLKSIEIQINKYIEAILAIKFMNYEDISIHFIYLVAEAVELNYPLYHQKYLFITAMFAFGRMTGYHKMIYIFNF